MRLIDADALQSFHMEITDENELVWEYDIVLLEDIKKAPTVETSINMAAVPPEKIMRIGAAERGLYYCGACHRRIAMADMFCRDCGVRIDWSECHE